MTDHTSAAQLAFDRANLPDPPRTVADALHYTTLLLDLLPEAEHAGYLATPAGENIAQLPDGTWVKAGRICYPDGSLVKIMVDVPNGGPEWVGEDPVDPSRYHPLPDPHASEWPGYVVPRIQALESWYREQQNQIGVLNRQLAALDARVVKVEQRPVASVPVKPWWQVW